jgi:hypothetical protein
VWLIDDVNMPRQVTSWTLGVAAIPPVFPEHGFEQRLRASERGKPQSLRRLREIDESGLRCEFEQAQCAGDA